MQPRLAWPAWLGPVIVVALGLGAVLVVDHDGDGANGWTELGAGTALTDGDTDRDGLPDGHELANGLPPRTFDADGDGLGDGVEVERGADPHARDTDRDGLDDAQEPNEDCDGDGRGAVASSDDDGDGRPDVDEAANQRCQADTDSDGVLDGHEGHGLCIVRRDCDRDGLDDGQEASLRYDPLDPDTFGTGLTDAVAYAFEQGGQEPGADADGDGIPDPWETGSGLIDWNGLDPRPGRRDLLVEYVWVTGPDSSQYDLDATDAYEAVAALFADERDIAVSWVETRVELDDEQRPDVLTEETWSYYDAVLARSVHAHNPLVTTVVLNPQQQQQHAGDILGAAFLRSMIATIDYGAHTDLFFENPDLGRLGISPVIESHIVTNDQAKIETLGFDAGGVGDDGRIWLRDDDGSQLGAPGTMGWEPDWFDRPPVVDYDDFGRYAFTRDGFTLREGELAATIAHELGHTLGLCHAHEPGCYRDFSPTDQDRRDTSTMSYLAPQDALHFLDSEWQSVDEYLHCPPEDTVRLVADGVDGAALRSAKYQTSFVEEGSQRACGDLDPLIAEFAPVAATHYEATVALPAGGLDAARSGTGAFVAHVVATALAAAGAWFFLDRRVGGPRV